MNPRQHLENELLRRRIAGRLRIKMARVPQRKIEDITEIPRRPFLGLACPLHTNVCGPQNHIESYTRCGLLLSRYLQTNDSQPWGLKNVPEFLKQVGGLPSELRDLIYANLMPFLPSNRKLWLYSPSVDKKANQYFCNIQGIVQVLYEHLQDAKGKVQEHEMLVILRNESHQSHESATKIRDRTQIILNEFLTYVGHRLVVQLACHESKHASMSPYREWLGSLSLLGSSLKHLTLDIAVTDTLESNDYSNAVVLSEEVSRTFPSLENINLYLHVSTNDIEEGIYHPDEQRWISACRKLGEGRDVALVKVFLTEIKDKQNTFYSLSWFDFFNQRKNRDTRYWRENLVVDEKSFAGYIKSKMT